MEHVALAVFSPTGGTRTLAEQVAKGLGVKKITVVDQTLPAAWTADGLLPADAPVILGAPVYGGRLPALAVERLRRLRGSGQPAVLLVSYGNREFEDALLELRQLAVEMGLRPVAGAAFIAEHSFSSTGLPIAQGRPDVQDLALAGQFGAQVALRLAAEDADSLADRLELPGRFPYESAGARAMAVAPDTDAERCGSCGHCATVCPSGAISLERAPETDAARCIRCCACIKACPNGARQVADEMWLKICQWLHGNCATPKSPQLFGVAG